MSTGKTAAGAASSVIGGTLVVALVGLILWKGSAQASPLSATVKGTVQTPRGTLPHAFLSLATYPDSMAGEHGSSGGAHPDWVSYGPTTALRVPAHSLVTVTVRQYDSGGAISNAYFAAVHGTVDGTMTVDGKSVTHLPASSVAHTFTLHALPTNQDPLFVSVPLPPVSGTAPNAAGSQYPKPHVVTFSFVTGGRGQYVWNCEFPCGVSYASFGGPMSTRRYMSGTLTVT